MTLKDQYNKWKETTLKKSLEKEGMTAVLAQDAAEAFERMNEGGIAIVLMDIRMPCMSGF